MVTLGIIQNGKSDLSEFFTELDDRLQRSNFILNPFRGFVRKQDKDFYVMVIKPLYPNPTIITVILLGVILFLTGVKLTGWVLIPLVLLVFSIMLWSPIAYKFLIKKMLKKKGYEIALDFVESEEILRRIYGVTY